jgi:hypothetical protein
MTSKGTAPKPDTIEKHVSAFFPPVAVLAGMQLDLFTPLGQAPMDTDSLAGALGVSPTRLRPLLYMLVTAELLTLEGGRFALTPEAERFLVRDRPDYLGAMHELWSDLYAATLQSAESIRSGAPQAKHDFGDMSNDELGAFFRGLHPGAMAAGRYLARKHELARFRHLLDVAGGSGGLAIAACGECPELQASVAELPSITAFTERFISDAGMTERIGVVAVDLNEGPPEGRYDAAVLRNFIQVLSADQARNVIRHVGEAMEPDGVIHIVGFVLDGDRLSPPEAAAMNLVFLNIYDHGQAYTDEEHRTWLAEAGFVDIERVSLNRGFSLVTARKGS